jgi:hypothetical protein
MSNQGNVQAAVRARHGQAGNRDWNGDWHELFDQEAVPAGLFNERLLTWINTQIGESYGSIAGAKQAYAEFQGFYNWSSMTTIASAAIAAETSTLTAAMDVAPTIRRKGLINTYVAGLKTAGVWTKLDLLYVLAAHDEQAARLNWVAPATFEAVNVGAGPTFVADRGITGNGSSTAWSTGYTPATHASQLAQDSASLWVWCLTNVAENAADFGAAVTHNSFVRTRSAGDAISYTVNGATTSTVGSATSIGMTGISRADGTNQQAWKNGAASGAAAAGASTGLPAAAFRIGGRGNDLWSTKQIAMAAAGAALSAGEAEDFYDLTLAYLQGVGAA